MWALRWSFGDHVIAATGSGFTSISRACVVLLLPKYDYPNFSPAPLDPTLPCNLKKHSIYVRQLHHLSSVSILSCQFLSSLTITHIAIHGSQFAEARFHDFRKEIPRQKEVDIFFFFFFLQVIFSLHTNEQISLESLKRWNFLCL